MDWPGPFLDAGHQQAVTRGCRRLYSTSEPDNTAAYLAWLAFGFTNMVGGVT